MKNFEKTENPNARWKRIKEDIEIGIIKGVYPVGECIPSIRQMSKLYNISSNTALHVLESLSKDNVVFKRAGAGYMVKPYVKEELIRNMKQDYTERIEDIISIGLRRGFSKKEICDMFYNVFTTVATKEERKLENED